MTASQRLHKVEARIDGKWIAIFSSHHRNLVTAAFTAYQKIAPWRVRISRK